MKFNRHTYILLSAVFCFMLTACSDEIMNLAEGEVGEFTSPADDDGMVDVTFKLSIDPSMIAKTRAVDGQSTEDVNLENLDLFIYVIRDENNNILYQYGKGLLDESLEQEPAFDNYTPKDDNNQTLMRVTWTKEEDEDDNNGDDSEIEGSIAKGRYSLEEELTLRVMRNTVFKFSCWAQSSQSRAYDFDYLTALKVNYSKMSANSEINDAFCATSIFAIGLRDATVSITLSRPFAQINVGIDEEILNNEDERNVSFGAESEKYKYSKMKLNGVATAFDVVKNKVWTLENIERYLLCKYYKKTGKKKEGYDNDYYDDAYYILADSLYGNYSDNLFGDATIENTYEVISDFELPYSLMPGLKKEDGSATITGELDKLTVFDFSTWEYKYYRKLAMAYVLVPDFDNDETDKSTSTIDLKSFNVAKDINGDSEIIYEPKDKYNPEKPLSISVKRNWRTNLLFTGWDWLDNTTNTTPTTTGNQ